MAWTVSPAAARGDRRFLERRGFAGEFPTPRTAFAQTPGRRVLILVYTRRIDNGQRLSTMPVMLIGLPGPPARLQAAPAHIADCARGRSITHSPPRARPRSR